MKQINFRIATTNYVNTNVALKYGKTIMKGNLMNHSELL